MLVIALNVKVSLLLDVKVAVLKVEFRIMDAPVPDALAMLVTLAVELLTPVAVEELVVVVLLLVELAELAVIVKSPE